MEQPAAGATLAPRYAQLWSAISRDFNGLRRQKTLEGSIDGRARLMMTPGDGLMFNLYSRRWSKWLAILDEEAVADVEVLAFLAKTNQESIELRLGMAWKGLLTLGGALALLKFDFSALFGPAVRDLAGYGTIGLLAIVILWLGTIAVGTYLILNHFWRINASEFRSCVDLALLARKVPPASEDG